MSKKPSTPLRENIPLSCSQVSCLSCVSWLKLPAIEPRFLFYSDNGPSIAEKQQEASCDVSVEYLSQPVRDFDENHTYFLCCLPVHPKTIMPEGLIQGIKGVPAFSGTNDGQTGEVAGEVTDEVAPEVTPQVMAIFSVLKGEMSRSSSC